MTDILDRLTAALADRYSVEREFRRGGMAILYLAMDRKHQRSVAVKVLRPELAATLGPDRFLQEIQIAARLQHPNILPLFDSGDAAGLLYYVVPYIEGESLRDRLTREPELQLEEALQIVRQVAAALHYAHAHGVVHRDVKPENILLSSGQAVVADFGIARAISAAGGSNVTGTGFTVGTPAYMSPEQAIANEELDGRADEYSLGCVLYEMLTGAPPFTGPSAQAILARHSSDPVPTLRTVRGSIPDAVEHAVTKSLAKSPADRFPTVQQFAEALSAAALPRLHLGGRTARRAAYAAVAALVVVGVARAVSGRQTATPPKSTESRPMIAVLPFENLGAAAEAYFADGITDEITSRIAQNRGLTVISRASAMHYNARETPVTQIARELKVDYVLTGTIRTDRRPGGSGVVRVTPELTRVADQQLVWSGRYDARLAPGAIVHVQGVIAEGVAEALNVRLLLPEQPALETRPTESLEAYDYYLRGNLFARQFLVEEGTRRAVEMYQRAVAVDPEFALAYAKLAQARSMLYYFFDRSNPQLELASRAVDRAFALGRDLPEARIALGYFYYWGRLDYERALEQFRAALERQPNNSELLWVTGSVWRRQGRWNQALENFQAALRLNPRSHIFAFEVGGTLQLLRRYAEVEPYYDQAVTLAPDWVPAVASKALLYAYQGDVAGARRVMRDAARRLDPTRKIVPVLIGEIAYRPMLAMLGEYYEQALERFSLRTAAVDSGAYYLAKAELFHRRGRPLQARAYDDSARVVWEPKVQAHQEDAAHHIELGTAYAGLGRSTDAVREASTAAALHPVSKDALRGAFWALQLARLYVATGAEDAAIDQLKALLAIPAPISIAELRIDPGFDPLRGNPRFQALLVGR